jgi:hypothetical protein
VDVRRGGGALLTLSARQLEGLVRELAGLLRGARVKDVQALPPRDLLFVLAPEDGDGRIRRLRVSANGAMRSSYCLRVIETSM